MDAGFQAGAVEVDVLEADGGGEPDVTPLVCRPGEPRGEAGVDLEQSRLIEPAAEAVAGALGESPGAARPADAQEPLQQLAVGEARAEVAVAEAGEVARQVAAQCQDTGAGEAPDAPGAGGVEVDAVVANGELDELVLQAGACQDLVDALEQVALVAVFLRAVDAD